MITKLLFDIIKLPFLSPLIIGLFIIGYFEDQQDILHKRTLIRDQYNIFYSDLVSLEVGTHKETIYNRFINHPLVDISEYKGDLFIGCPYDIDDDVDRSNCEFNIFHLTFDNCNLLKSIVFDQSSTRSKYLWTQKNHIYYIIKPFENWLILFKYLRRLRNERWCI